MALSISRKFFAGLNPSLNGAGRHVFNHVPSKFKFSLFFSKEKHGEYRSIIYQKFYGSQLSQ